MVKKLWWSSSLGLLLLILAGSALPAAAQVRPADFHLLNRLAGTWIMKTRRGAVIENWSRLNDSTWLGKTWRVIGPDTTLQQSVELARQGADIFFIPIYAGSTTPTPIRLRLRVLKAIGFVGEDLQQDFPQKVTYRFKDEDHLEARVVGKRDGTVEEYIFSFRKE
ncbi:hypothetical protein [Chitinophaga solisilvae]|uniref:DUF1579 domain-containing protein n=1 Tax=Chitinophaga solisilvae TaxID=1233460 RepID=A0A9Q5GVQ4_9BACT|nr:hypothetical protein [Chitinophaga solisilvae]NSL87038.1 hypothetical protein [Chitinophaga solisilvae]